MNAYIICSVRGATENLLLTGFVNHLESNGVQCHYPPRDMDQTKCGTDICIGHRQAMIDCDIIIVAWNNDSIGSHFDFGMAYHSHKPVFLFNSIYDCKAKSYGQVLRETAKDLLVESVRCYEPATKYMLDNC